MRRSALWVLRASSTSILRIICTEITYSNCAMQVVASDPSAANWKQTRYRPLAAVAIGMRVRFEIFWKVDMNLIISHRYRKA